MTKTKTIHTAEVDLGWSVQDGRSTRKATRTVAWEDQTWFCGCPTSRTIRTGTDAPVRVDNVGSTNAHVRGRTAQCTCGTVHAWEFWLP